MGLPQASQILTPAPGEKVKERLYIGLLLAIVVFAYGNTLVNAFTMDDIALYVVRNTQVTHPSLPALFAPHQATNVFRPVTFSTFALDWKLGGGRAELVDAGFLLSAWILHLRDREISALICFVLALLSKESAVVFLRLAAIGKKTTADSLDSSANTKQIKALISRSRRCRIHAASKNPAASNSARPTIEATASVWMGCTANSRAQANATVFPSGFPSGDDRKTVCSSRYKSQVTAACSTRLTRWNKNGRPPPNFQSNAKVLNVTGRNTLVAWWGANSAGKEG